ncbi:MAG: PKD domain-containing protein [Bacteroidia bacterium]|nr:PKD domain-containing protein [Bacteroidia bacterium]
MRHKFTFSTLAKAVLILLFAVITKNGFSQGCDPKWDKIKSSNCENSPIQFYSNAPGLNSYEWDFGDGFKTGVGTTTAFRDPVHSYTSAGLYTVTFKGTGPGGTSCTDTVMILIKESPKVKTKALTPLAQCFMGNKFCFIDSTKASKGSKLLSIKYLFSDGALYTINDPKGGDTICHSVIDPNGGFFDLTIEAEDYNGCITKTFYAKLIRVYPKIGVKFTSVGPHKCNKTTATVTNLTDTFTKLNEIAFFKWDFGDPGGKSNIIIGDSVTNTEWWKGKTGNGVFVHEYDATGKKSGTYVYNGSLTVTTKYGCTETFKFSAAATVSTLKPKIIIQPDSSCVSESEVKFSLEDGPIANAKFLWNFGDPLSGPANFDDKSWTPTHSYGLGPWMASIRIIVGPCDVTTTTSTSNPILKIGPGSTIEIPFNRVPEDEKYQCVIRDSVHFPNNSKFYHNDPYPVFEDSSNVNRYFTLLSGRKVGYYEPPLKQDSIDPYGTYKVMQGLKSRIYLEKDTLETFYQSVLTADSIYYFVNGKKVKKPVVNPVISGKDTVIITKVKDYVFKWPGDQTAVNSKFPPPTQRHKDHVIRLWTFGDNYAPKCTTDTKKNKNVGLNCNFSMDSLPVHWYTPWDDIYKYYNNSQFYSTAAQKTVLCKNGRFCYKINYYPVDTLVVPDDTLIIVPKDSTFIYAGDTIKPSTKEKMDGFYRIKKVPSKLKGLATYTPTLSEEKWTFYTTKSILVKNITTGNKYLLTSGTKTLKKGDQFQLNKGDSAISIAQVVITKGKLVVAQKSTVYIDTIIGGRDTFIQSSRIYIDSAFHRENFYLKNAQCNSVTLYHEDTVHAFRCKATANVSLALLPPNGKGLKFKGIKCYAPPSPPYGMEFDVGETKPGCTQRLLKFNFDSAGGKNNWVTHGGFLPPPLPGMPPWHMGYQLSGAYPTKFVQAYTAGSLTNKNPGWVTVGVIIGNGRWLDKAAPLDSIECIDTTWYHNAFRYLYLDSRFTVIQPEADMKRVCVGDTISFLLTDPIMDSVTQLVWNWNDKEGTYYEERFSYYKPYKGPSPTRNDKDIVWNKNDKWLYNYVIRINYDGVKDNVLDTIVTGIIRKWSIGLNMERAGDALSKAFKALGLEMTEIPSTEIPLYFGNGSGFGCIDTTGLGDLITLGVAPYRDNLTFRRGTTWYRYTDNTKKDSTIISQKLHFRDSSMIGFDTLKQKNPNKYSNKKVTPNVYRHVYKRPNRYFPSLTLRNTEGCIQPKNKEVDVGFDWIWTFSDSIICHGNTEIQLKEQIRYYAYEDPFIWLDPRAWWEESKRYLAQRETKKIDFNEHDDSISANVFNVTGIGVPPFRWHYDDPGIYNIRIAMKDSLGCRDTAKQRVWVTGVKAAFKILNPTLGCKNIVSFLDSSVMIDPCVADKGVPCDNIIEYTWDFGDGKQKSKLKNPSHDYTQNGWFTIRLKVKTKLGCEDSTSMKLFIAGPQPKFNPVSDTVVCVGDTVIFNNLSIDPIFNPVWEWNFGDGKVLSDNARRSVGHRYIKEGIYEVYLTQHDNIKGTSIRCSAIYPDTSADLVIKLKRIIRVKPKAPAQFSIAPKDTICVNSTATLTTVNTDTVYTRYIWRFGDGDTISTTSNSANHTYNKTGQFKLTLIPDYDLPVGEFRKCLDTVKKVINVIDVKADFDIDSTNKPKFCFTNKSVGATTYEWTFENFPTDGFSSDQDPCYEWADTGCYNIKLVAINSIGCRDSIVKPVCYKYVSKFIPYNVFTPEPKDGVNDEFRVNAVGLEEFDIIIYNRWGEKVFESKDQNFRWNGKVKNTGAECPEGTYFYIINYKVKNQGLNGGKGKDDPVSGTVTLIRGK